MRRYISIFITSSILGTLKIETYCLTGCDCVMSNGVLTFSARGNPHRALTQRQCYTCQSKHVRKPLIEPLIRPLQTPDGRWQLRWQRKTKILIKDKSDMGGNGHSPNFQLSKNNINFLFRSCQSVAFFFSNVLPFRFFSSGLFSPPRQWKGGQKSSNFPAAEKNNANRSPRRQQCWKDMLFQQ